MTEEQIKHELITVKLDSGREVKKFDTQRDLSGLMKQYDADFFWNQPNLLSVDFAGLPHRLQIPNLSLKEKFKLYEDFITTWIKGNKGDISYWYGKEAAELAEKPLLATLTGDQKQFRIWHDQPGLMTYRHVNSGGSGLLLGVESRIPILDPLVEIFKELSGGYEAEPCIFPAARIIVPKGEKVVYKDFESRLTTGTGGIILRYQQSFYFSISIVKTTVITEG